MSGHDRRSDAELLDDAEVYALHALDPVERAEVEEARAAAAPDIREDFDGRVSATLETMAAQAARDGYDAPPEHVFDGILARLTDAKTAIPLRKPASRWMLGAAAALVAVALIGGVLLGRTIWAENSGPTTSQTDTVLAAPDARTVQARVGDATISFIYSRTHNAGVVLMNDVPPPQADTIYQMWLMDPGGGARSRGTMTPTDVRPTTIATVPAIDGATSFGISVEAPGGAKAPSRQIVTTLPIAAR